MQMGRRNRSAVRNARGQLLGNKPLPPVPGPQRQRQPRRRRGQNSRNGAGAGPDSSVGPNVGLASAYARSQRGGVNTSESDRTGMQHELIATVAGSTGFAVTPYVINPGNPTTFPWLSDIAAKWESYRFNYLRFRYETRKGTSTDGSVIMAIDYDPTDAPPVSEAVMTTYSGAVEDATWKNCACTGAVSQLHKIGPQKYVRQATLPTGANVVDFDCGNFMFGTTAQADATNIGKLWVDYDVTFYTKQTAAGLSAPANNRVAQFADSSNVLASGVDEVSPIGTQDFNGIGAVNTAGAITLPAGNYLCSTSVRFNAVTLLTAAVLSIRKNGSILRTRAVTLGAAAVAQDVNIALDQFVQSDGNDTVDLVVNLTGTGGVTNSSVLTILAV